MNLKALCPTTSFGFKKTKLPHIGDLSKPYFVTVGCSNTAGTSEQDEDIKILDYDCMWPSVVAQDLQMQHINIGFAGASVQYLNPKLKKGLKLLSNAKFVLYMIPFPIRSHSKLFFLDDHRKRCYHKTLWREQKTLLNIKNTVEMFSEDKVIFTNNWGYDIAMLNAMTSLYKKYSKFIINYDPIIDKGEDNNHPGKNTHIELSRKIVAHIRQNFSDWF
tara:strand:- start:698 stop:1351 length:654 start_codon:yes stop_codon:yes gene_type:complete